MVYPYLNYSWNGNKIVEYAPTSHNRSVCVAPPVGGLGLNSARSVACGSFPRRIAEWMPALAAYLGYDAAQSPYTGRQNVVNSRNVIRNKNGKVN